MDVDVIELELIDGEDKEDEVQEFSEKVNDELIQHVPPAKREKVRFVHGPLIYKDGVLVQQVMKRHPHYVTTVEALLEKKSSTLVGIKETAMGLMSVLLRAFAYLLLPVGIVGITIVEIGKTVAGAAGDFEMRWPSGDVFPVDASWFAPDIGTFAWPTMGSVHVFIDDIAFPRLDGFTLPTLDGTFIYYAGRFFRVPDGMVEELRGMVATESARAAAALADAAAVHDAVRGSAFGLPKWLTSINYSSLAATSAKMALIVIAGPITFLLATAATLGGTVLPSVLLVIQPLLVCIDLLIDTYAGTYPLDEFSRYYKERMHNVWDNYKEVIGSIPESVYENVKSMVAAVS